MLIDSNILIYAINIASSKHKTAQKFIENTKENFAIADQNIFETLRIITHPRFPKPMEPKAAVNVISQLVASFQIIIPNHKTQFLAFQLIDKFEISGIRVFDAYLVATALSNSIDTIATDNIRDFKKFAGIKIVNPFAAKVTL
ncbi:MAG: hypothetical protein A3C30_04525 [Candidatus Levybacteria bacterium RIFCSPHIGHO2_02_FULL_40_18]|nr:MAG: hypothetical protein A2869_02180 [Candidatus Levybacteria bacterium RIFCSPHIGHO2_01_FULL_40_58]OGH26345.1 MAG: hypothetical protein A3C30_04525 [Candidatus Levybacteria bacterium RIFCSPHIGHO2_02_FULL_40_18]OGH31792.1 MAG: hypothetical protein A3E43_00320 [Candidatus Levybacteria bacterium RIFCSPHIGHO2_12_FULL_40_31]OGH40425.1 MAG: hypothetical protein A2894_00825 [Candidatus Levybacteria bacterium RIFCSPLOWO2_01_FULL_40_64]OGH49135.1 MAG: hypothetical protein A3I54_04220 [Candidatus Lev